MTKHLRVLRPAPNIYAFYDGRVEGYRFADGVNWVDDGALSLGIASYAIVGGEEALIYDTHISLNMVPSSEGFENRRQEIRGRLATGILITLGPCLCDSLIISNKRTLDHLTQCKPAIESGAYSGPPVVNPLHPSNRDFEGQMQLQGH
jgi:hypothetical protein